MFCSVKPLYSYYCFVSSNPHASCLFLSNPYAHLKQHESNEMEWYLATIFVGIENIFCSNNIFLLLRIETLSCE
jgi:hypothetical protein